MKLEYMLIPYFSNLNTAPPPLQILACALPSVRARWNITTFLKAKDINPHWGIAKTAQSIPLASLYLVRRWWFSIAGVWRAHPPTTTATLLLFLLLLPHTLSACGRAASAVATPPAQPRSPVSLLSPRGFLIESDPIMSQQLAINVINYSSTLVTSERDADVE